MDCQEMPYFFNNTVLQDGVMGGRSQPSLLGFLGADEKTGPKVSRSEWQNWDFSHFL